MKGNRSFLPLEEVRHQGRTETLKGLRWVWLVPGKPVLLRYVPRRHALPGAEGVAVR